MANKKLHDVILQADIVSSLDGGRVCLTTIHSQACRRFLETRKVPGANSMRRNTCQWFFRRLQLAQPETRFSTGPDSSATRAVPLIAVRAGEEGRSHDDLSGDVRRTWNGSSERTFSAKGGRQPFRILRRQSECWRERLVHCGSRARMARYGSICRFGEGRVLGKATTMFERIAGFGLTLVAIFVSPS